MCLVTHSKTYLQNFVTCRNASFERFLYKMNTIYRQITTFVDKSASYSHIRLHGKQSLLSSVAISNTLSYLKVASYSITSVGHGANPGFLAISQQVTLVINPVVGCHYCPPGPRLLPSQRYQSLPLANTKLYCLVTEAHRCK